ncbi:MAG: rhomboid family intramembrane serine protease [Xanthomonadales bacterium]|nr:rhomboid family intramembrane serine protease [Xanthomonadales bacterium]
MFKIHRPDPNYVTSERSKNNFKLALKATAVFVGVLWAIHMVNWGLDYSLNRFGIWPRNASGMVGVVAAPLLHSGFAHLFKNSLPLLVLGTGMLFVYPNASARALPAIYVGTGLLVWLFGRGNIHIGASGLIYGMLAFVFFSGIVKRDARGVALSMLVFFLYGSMTWGIFPQGNSVSWESHLAGAVVGTVLALRFKAWDIPPRKRYDWEDDE